MLLYRLLSLPSRTPTALVTLETGFANGGSATAILSALIRGDWHIAIDPKQDSWGRAGLWAAHAHLTSRTASGRPTFVHLNETAAMAMA